MAQVLDLYLLHVTYRNCRDARPCIVIQFAPGRIAALACVSAASDRKRPGLDFVIRSDHPDFIATGLKRTSYVSGDDFVNVSECELKRYLGRLENGLANEFKNWIGI